MTRVGDFHGTGALNLKPIVECLVFPDLLGSEAGIGVINFDQPDRSGRVVHDRGPHVRRMAAAEASQGNEGRE